MFYEGFIALFFMRALIQKTTHASVIIAQETVAQIQTGLLVLIGIETADTEQDILWLCNKIINLRIFIDETGIMNLSVKDIAGNILVVSQFTLHASTKKGNRPSYIKAAKPEIAIPLYENFKSTLEKELGKPIQSGVFGENMQVQLINDGPVTILIDSQNKE
jgi:D-aminoacyl-tRNA deacylase